MTYLLLLVTVLVGGAMAGCPDIPTLAVFDIAQYMGQWYEIQRYPQLGESSETCVQVNYTLQADESVRLENRGKKPDGRIDDIKGTATVPDPAHPAELLVVFDEGFRGSYNVIRTDYAQAALIYTCRALGPLLLENAWIMSREPVLDQDLVEAYRKVLADGGSDISQFSVTPQDCGDIF
ncbi:apolipoprotein D-like [Pollicipes pollicipes]|uniref:apolipoprotein D-like n=1 Tax=Pollicipes pollicipes TaxID=41117 RepID=UPI00188539EF|nr:apolipoprotein D-like [Pollicipes pollicipes]